MKIAIIGTTILAAVGLILALRAYLRTRKSDDADESRADVMERIVSLLRAAAPALVTVAEKHFGGGTGEVKLSWVIGELMKLIPDALKPLVGRFDLEAIIEAALGDMKELWGRVPGLVELEADVEVTLEETEPLRVVSLADLKAGQVAELQRGVAVLLEPAPAEGE